MRGRAIGLSVWVWVWASLGGLALADEAKQVVMERLGQDLKKIDLEIRKLKAQVQVQQGQVGMPDSLFALAEKLADKADKEGMLAAEQGVSKYYDAPKVVSAREAAVAALGRILTEFPGYPKPAEALLLRAQQNRHLGRYDDFARDLQTLLVKHPKSRKVEDALILLGDYYFDRTDLVSAKKVYQQLENYPQSPLLGYARYKLAWVAVNGKDFARAAELFVKVAQAPVVKGDGGKAARNLRLNALKDLVFCSTEIQAPDKALTYFQKLKLSREEELQVLPRLARRLWIKEEFRAALVVYDHLIPIAEDGEDRKEWQERAQEAQKLLSNQL